jgi:hypothetical protein
MVRRAAANLLGIFAAACMLLWGALALPRPAQATEGRQTGETIVQITAPAQNDRVSGVVMIVGTVIDPNFVFYQLEYALEPLAGEPIWMMLQPPVTQQVREGVLGVWDTTLVADGRYLVRLQVARADGTLAQYVLRVEVANATPTPSPTIPPPPTPTPLPGTPTPGPSPTPLIWQPPTRTPRPTATPGGPTLTPTPFDVNNSPLDPNRLRGAAWTGVKIALGAFGFLALYSLVRAAVRGQLRVILWRFRREVINPLFDRPYRRRKK